MFILVSENNLDIGVLFLILDYHYFSQIQNNS